MKKLVISLLSALMVLGLMMPVSAAVVGDGSKENPYIIKTAEDIKALDQEERYIYAELGDNIVLDNVDGSDYTLQNFRGELNGKNYKLTTSGDSFIKFFVEGSLNSFTWEDNFAGTWLVYDYKNPTSEHVFENITVTGNQQLTANNNNESPLIVYASGNTTMKGVKLNYSLSSPTYNGLFIGYEPYKESNYKFIDCSVEGNYTGDHLGVLFGNGSNSKDYGLQQIVGENPTSTLEVSNLDLSKAQIFGISSKPHLLCGVVYNADMYDAKENEIKAQTKSYENLIKLEQIKGYSLETNADGFARINVSEVNPNVAKFEVISEIYVNRYLTADGSDYGTLKVSLNETIDVMNIRTYYSNLGKVKFYDGTNGTFGTTGKNGKFDTIKVENETYYAVPKEHDGLVSTFGPSATPTNTTRTSNVRLVLRDQNDEILGTIYQSGSADFANPIIIETEAETYGEISLVDTTLNGGTWVNAKGTINPIPHTEYVFLNDSLYPVTVIKTNTNPVISVALNKTNLDLLVGNSEQLVATVTPTDADLATVTWSTSNSGVVEVSSNGTVTAIAPGTATITARTANGKFAECTVTVVKETPAPAPVCKGPKDKNCDGVVTCEEEMGKGWTWNNSKKVCEYTGSYVVVNTAAK